MVTQYATWDLIGPIAYEGYDPVNDPGWEKTGAPSPAFYARWCRHLCGIACLRMALLHRDGRAPDRFTLLTGARNAGAYVREPDGTVKGLIYAPFVEYTAHTHQLPGAVHGDLGLDGLVALLDAGHMVMASPRLQGDPPPRARAGAARRAPGTGHRPPGRRDPLP
ncbi:peptidase [Streptomyces sp. NPDC048256]|uniref:peptidase n=1 Tax=unclassified Streptomyces TaxID=2593676 RepID=UPI0033EC203B